eukprot:1995447-Pyramimonas_sp.AAC.1
MLKTLWPWIVRPQNLLPLECRREVIPTDRRLADPLSAAHLTPACETMPRSASTPKTGRNVAPSSGA